MRVRPWSQKGFLSILGVSSLFAALLWGQAMAASGQPGRAASLEGEVRLSQAAAERKMLRAGKEMMEGRKLILQTLRKTQEANKQEALQDGAKLIAEGERMIREGERMFSKKQDTIKAERLLMEGSTKMMEGKDRLLNALAKEGLSNSTQARKGAQLLAKGASQLLDAKNAFEQGEKSSLE